MSAFASPAETDRFPIRSSTFAEAPVRAEMEAHVLMNPLLRGGVTQAPYASAYQQDTQSQMQQHRRSITSGPPYPFAATLAPSLAVPVGVPLGREGSAEGVGASSPGEKLDVLGEASAQFAKAAIRLLWGGLRSDELHLHLDSPARGPFLGVGPWGRRVGGPLCTKAMYEENGNAFVVSDPQEWLPLPNCFSRLLCTCGAAENTGGSSGSVSCCCTEAPPCGFISELNSVWVGGEGFLYLWEVGSPEDAVEQLSVPGSVESVVYIHLDREVLPPALRASFCWDDADLAAFSVTAHLAPSGCTDSPPFSSINASPLHCIAVSLTSSVRLFAISARAGAPRRNLISHLQHGRGGPPRSSQAAPASVCCCGMEFTEIGVADKPMRGFSGGPLELSHAVAHKGSSHVFFGSTSSQQVFRLEVGPRAGPPGGPRWGPPVAPAGAVEAQGFRLWSRRTEGDDGLVTCRLAALNPKLSDWLRSSIALGVRRFFGLASTPHNGSSSSSSRSGENNTGAHRQGLQQLQMDEARGILWALGSDSSVSAFLLPTLSAEQLASKEEDRNRYTTLRMTSKAIEEGLRSLGASWQRSPPAGCGGLLGPLLRTGGFVAVSLSVIPPQEGHSLAAVIVDASGGRTFLSLADPYSSSAPGSGAFPPPRNYAVRRPSAGPRGPPLRLVVGGYRGPIDPLPPSLGPLRCAAVASSVFLSAHAAKKEAGGACEEAAAPQAEEDRGAPLLLPRCGPCRNSCFVGAPCVLCAAFGNAGEGGPAGGLSGGLLDVQEPELPFIYEQSNGGSSASAAGSLCCCCKARPAIAEDAASPKCTAANNGSSDVLVAAAPDLRGLAMLQQGGCYSNNGGVAPGVTPASPLASNFFPSKTHLPTAQDPLRSQSSGRPPSLSNEWFCCFRLREGAGRVLLLCEPLPSPAFGVLQQCSSVFPSPFDSRKRQQWLSLPYGGDPFSSAEWEKRGLGGGPQRGLNGMSSKASICASLPAVCAPSALTDAAAGVLCGAPKLLVITSKYVLQVRRQTIAQIYVRSIENLMRGGPRLAALDDPRGIASAYGGGIHPQQQQQQQLRDGLFVSVGPQRHAHWRLGTLLTAHMCEEGQFGADAVFAAFWQLMTDSASALAAFHATQASSSGRQQGGGSEGGPPNTTNLLDKQRGALRLSRAGAYFQPPSAPQLMQGGISGGPLGFFETPFGLGYVQDSGRQQQQVVASAAAAAAAAARGGPPGGLGSPLGAPSLEAAAAGREGDGKAMALAVAWRALVGLEARREGGPPLNAELLGEQMNLPSALQEQQQTWGGRIFGYSDQKQLPQPQPPNQQQEGFSQTIGDPFLQPLPGSTSASSIPAVQSLPAGLSNTARGLILYASRLLRPILGTPLVEAALLPCGLARADPRSAHPQQQQQLGRLREEDEGTRKRGRGEFDWQPEELEDAVHRRHLCACLVGRFSAEAVDRLLSKIACLYEVLDAVYTTLFFSFGQKSSLQQQQQQQLAQGSPWALSLRGLPPHFAALRMPRDIHVDTAAATQEGIPSSAELEQQEVIWASISLVEAIELSVLYGISKVLITAHEMLTAYQLLMQQAEYSVQMGCSRFVQPLLFDRLLSLSLTDLREELEAQMLYLQLQRKLTERVHSEAAPTLPEVQNFVFYHLMPRLLFLPLEGLVSLLDSLKFYPLLVDVVTAKAAELTANFRLLTARRRAKWPSLNADSTHQNLADLQNLLISSCYRHVGECLSYHCKKLKEAEQEAPPADHQPHEQEDGKSHIDTSVQQESKACAAALVNACLGCSDENMQAYVLDWIATHGGKHFPIAMLQLDGPMADRLLAQSNAAAFATDLGECYAASGLYAQAAKCHSLQGLRHWSASEGRSRVFQEVSQAHAQQQLKADDSGKGANSMDASAVLVFDEHTDAFCCSLTRPVWQFLFSWLREHAQKPSLDERLLHFVKAKESAQNLLQKASGLSGQAGYGFPDKPVMGHFEKSSLRVAKESNIALDAGADGLSSASTERSLRQIDLNIRMVGIQRALLRDAAHLFCFTTLSCMQNHKRERALITGQPQASVEAVSAADAEAFCCRISGGFGSSMSEHADRSQEPDSRTDGCRAILVLMIDLQREVYAPAELLELLTAHMKDSGLAESLTSHFPSIAALRLYGQRVAAAAAKHLAWSQEQDAALAALDEACMAFLSFAEAASRALHQPRIVSDALRDLLALPDAPVRDSCSRSLKRLCVVLHLHAQSQWGDRDVGMLNAEGEIVHIPGFLWPAWRLAECGQSFPALIDLYLSFEQDESAKHHSRLHALNLQTIFCWIFEQWLTSQDDVACSGTYVGLLHELKEAGDLPYFGPPVSVPLWSQLNEQERARADTAAQRLTDMLLQIELAMSAATRANPNLKSERHFIGVHSRLAILKQQVAEYRAALHKHARLEVELLAQSMLLARV
ncbi:uncharacterized protein LOC34620921 [Cyclospora cayetanensis]|uniref:Uncharacterized protein LOC34620921 n=1 Tax=Cyclospora cayetanensis TaxID=88456 RepID=A0A6P6RSY8_9EIME|nr:uncharacterized protein LOC34620921 [Cyclospora cayetanensis]